MSEDAGYVISKSIKRLLKKQNKTQAWLASEMGIKPGYLSELLSNHPIKRWNADLIEQARKALNVSVTLLFIDDELANQIATLTSEDRKATADYVDFLLQKHNKAD
mgnify:CR=1 FL=1